MGSVGRQDVLERRGGFGKVRVRAGRGRGDGRGVVGVSDEVDFSLAILGPQVYVEDIHGVINLTGVKGKRQSQHRADMPGQGKTGTGRTVDILAVYLLAGLWVDDDQPDTRGRSDGAAVLVTKTAHSCALGLLDDAEPARSKISVLVRGTRVQGFERGQDETHLYILPASSFLEIGSILRGASGASCDWDGTPLLGMSGGAIWGGIWEGI